jgi:KRAB domain-containing zinc finger protein
MNKHVASVHEEKKTFKFDICDNSFSGKSQMKQHVLSVHEGKKPFKCDICDYSFSQKSQMKKHVESVHEGKNHSPVTFVTTTVLQKAT